MNANVEQPAAVLDQQLPHIVMLATTSVNVRRVLRPVQANRHVEAMAV